MKYIISNRKVVGLNTNRFMLSFCVVTIACSLAASSKQEASNRMDSTTDQFKEQFFKL